jgi:tetratricopeptide (TPR) repeat protein
MVYDAPSADDDQKRQVEAWVFEAIRKQPNAVGLKARLGAIWIWRSRYDEAAEWYRRMLAENPDNPDALNNLAWLLALRDQGNVQEALGLIDHAIDVMGAIPSLVDTRAVVLIRAGQLDQAILDLNRARSAEPRNPNFALHLAWAYQGKGKSDEARKAFQLAKEMGWTVAKSDPLERILTERWGRELVQ